MPQLNLVLLNFAAAYTPDLINIDRMLRNLDINVVILPRKRDIFIYTIRKLFMSKKDEINHFRSKCSIKQVY